jgi:hypothetical protein
VVNDLSSKDAEPYRDTKAAMIIDRFLPALVVWLGEDWILAFLKERNDFSMKINDVLVGPF